MREGFRRNQKPLSPVADPVCGTFGLGDAPDFVIGWKKWEGRLRSKGQNF